MTTGVRGLSFQSVATLAISSTTLNAVHNMAKGGVAAVQMRGILVHDEELAAGGVRVHRAGHADDTAGVLDGVGNAVLQELALDVPARGRPCRCQRVTARIMKPGIMRWKVRPL